MNHDNCYTVGKKNFFELDCSANLELDCFLDIKNSSYLMPKWVALELESARALCTWKFSPSAATSVVFFPPNNKQTAIIHDTTTPPQAKYKDPFEMNSLEMRNTFVNRTLAASSEIMHSIELDVADIRKLTQSRNSSYYDALDNLQLLQSENAVLKDIVVSKDAELDKLKGKADHNLNQLMSDYEDRFAACNSEMDRVLSQCNHAVESRNALEAQLNSHKATFSEFEHKLQTHESSIDKLTISNQALQSENKELRDKVAEMTQYCSMLESSHSEISGFKLEKNGQRRFQRPDSVDSAAAVEMNGSDIASNVSQNNKDDMILLLHKRINELELETASLKQQLQKQQHPPPPPAVYQQQRQPPFQPQQALERALESTIPNLTHSGLHTQNGENSGLFSSSGRNYRNDHISETSAAVLAVMRAKANAMKSGSTHQQVLSNSMSTNNSPVARHQQHSDRFTQQDHHQQPLFSRSVDLGGSLPRTRIHRPPPPRRGRYDTTTQSQQQSHDSMAFAQDDGMQKNEHSESELRCLGASSTDTLAWLASTPTVFADNAANATVAAASASVSGVSVSGFELFTPSARATLGSERCNSPRETISREFNSTRATRNELSQPLALDTVSASAYNGPDSDYPRTTGEYIGSKSDRNGSSPHSSRGDDDDGDRSHVSHGSGNVFYAGTDEPFSPQQLENGTLFYDDEGNNGGRTYFTDGNGEVDGDGDVDGDTNTIRSVDSLENTENNLFYADSQEPVPRSPSPLASPRSAAKDTHHTQDTQDTHMYMDHDDHKMAEAGNPGNIRVDDDGLRVLWDDDDEQGHEYDSLADTVNLQSVTYNAAYAATNSMSADSSSSSNQGNDKTEEYTFIKEQSMLRSGSFFAPKNSSSNSNTSTHAKNTTTGTKHAVHTYDNTTTNTHNNNNAHTSHSSASLRYHSTSVAAATHDDSGLIEAMEEELDDFAAAYELAPSSNTRVDHHSQNHSHSQSNYNSGVGVNDVGISGASVGGGHDGISGDANCRSNSSSYFDDSLLYSAGSSTGGTAVGTGGGVSGFRGSNHDSSSNHDRGGKKDDMLLTDLADVMKITI